MKSIEVILTTSIICAILPIMFPLPATLLDGLLVINLISAISIFLLTLQMRKLQIKELLCFSLFPTLLLTLSFYNLIILISSARIILTMGSAFDGRLILFVASFISDSNGIVNMVVGFVIYAVFVLLLIITVFKGTSRISEVAARFTLESLPGKQMAVNAVYNSGEISEEESMSRKCYLQREVDFYGALDGAIKFIFCIFIARICITGIIIIVGILFGTKFYGEEIITATGIYVPLSVATGFFALFSVFFESIAARIVITKLNPIKGEN